jgi:hypothetical protein
MSLNKVNKRNEALVFKNMYGVNNIREILFNQKGELKGKIKRGDKVRNKYVLKPFDKGYYPTWTEHIYTIEKVIKGEKKLYFILKDYLSNIIKQRFYAEELQKVSENLHRVKKVLKTRLRRGKTEYFVK